MLELSKLWMYDAHDEVLQPFFALGKLQLHYRECDSIVFSAETTDLIKELKNLGSKKHI